jgi:hypothetical protein
MRSVKGMVQRVHRPIDDAAIEPKEKTTKGRDRRNRNDVKAMLVHNRDFILGRDRAEVWFLFRDVSENRGFPSSVGSCNDQVGLSGKNPGSLSVSCLGKESGWMVEATKERRFLNRRVQCSLWRRSATVGAATTRRSRIVFSARYFLSSILHPRFVAAPRRRKILLALPRVRFNKACVLGGTRDWVPVSPSFELCRVPAPVSLTTKAVHLFQAVGAWLT